MLDTHQKQPRLLLVVELRQAEEVEVEEAAEEVTSLLKIPMVDDKPATTDSSVTKHKLQMENRK
ncbi:hypothetical protein M1146_03765 [Patescibacteria group bacterium]|nr:hypothetical protein [Patescibacteria group bacterium]